MARLPRSFALRLALVTALGLAVRLVWALAVRGGTPVTGDGNEFHQLAQLIAHLHRYVEFAPYAGVPTAEKPPLYPLLLAVPAQVGWHSVAASRVVSCLLGSGTVAVVGLVGRRVAGPAAGLVAALLAALYPSLWALDATVRSESLYALLIALALLAALRARELPALRRALAVGLLIGLAALTRAEAVALVVLLGVPLALLVPRGRRLRIGLAVLAGCAVVVAPWLARNWIVFDRPAPISTNTGGLLAGANCPASYYSPQIGWWACLPRLDPRWGRNEAAISAHWQSQGTAYIGDHTGRLPAVLAARLGRTWGLFRPWQQTTLESFYTDRDLREEHAGLFVYYALLVSAAAGLALLRRRPERWLMLAPVALVVLQSLLSYGSFRFRVAADVTIVVLAAVALVRLVERVLGRTRAPAASTPAVAP